MEQEVTQADRDAAVGILQLSLSNSEERAIMIEGGEIDNDPLVQAFTRHRLAPTEALRAEIAAQAVLLEKMAESFAQVQASELKFSAEAVVMHARIETLEGALKDVCNPLGYLKRKAEAEGNQLSKLAWNVANDLSFVQNIARQALQGQSDE